VFLRRRERAKSEFRRRNIFELYIEEVVEACARLKGGKLPKDKLKTQLQKIAAKRTGGTKTDEILGRDGGGPEGLPHSIIVTLDGPEGEAPVLPSPVVDTSTATETATVATGEAPAAGKAAAHGKPTRGKARHGTRAKRAAGGQPARTSGKQAGAPPKRGAKKGKRR